MLPDHEAARVISDRQRIEAEHAARAHGQRVDRQVGDAGRPTDPRHALHRAVPRSEPDCRPCTPNPRIAGQPG